MSHALVACAPSYESRQVIPTRHTIDRLPTERRRHEVCSCSNSRRRWYPYIDDMTRTFQSQAQRQRYPRSRFRALTTDSDCDYTNGHSIYIYLNEPVVQRAHATINAMLNLRMEKRIKRYIILFRLILSWAVFFITVVTVWWWMSSQSLTCTSAWILCSPRTYRRKKQELLIYTSRILLRYDPRSRSMREREREKPRNHCQRSSMADVWTTASEAELSQLHIRTLHLYIAQ